MIKGKCIYHNKKCDKSLEEDRKFQQCFVWKADGLPIYIMDNHRTALWCWYKEIDIKNNLKLIHIDNHPDLSPHGLFCDCAKNLKLDALQIDNYLNLSHDLKHYHENIKERVPIFSNENFLTYFLEENKLGINRSNIISNANKSENSKISRKELLSHLETTNNQKWIVDLDLDYFFNEKTHKINLKFSKEVFTLLKKWHDLKKISVLTVAWSPEYLVDRENKKLNHTSKGWSLAKKLNSEFCKIFDIDDKYFKNI